jgi:cysteine desulfurase
MTKYIYMDNNATTPLHPEVKKAVEQSLDRYENPSSMHSYAREVKDQIKLSRKHVAELIGASPDEIVFTSCGSESNNQVLKQVLNQKYIYGKENSHIITSVIEHPCVLESCKYLEKMGIKVSYIPVDEDGIIDLKLLEKEIREETVLISVMAANNEIGVIQPIKEISAIAKNRGILFHTDAVQAVGKLPIDVKDWGVDFLTISGHKFYALKGIGVLYVRKGVKLDPFIHGGHQESQLRSGTENYSGIVSIGKAAQLIKSEMQDEINTVFSLKQKLIKGIEKKISDIRINGSQKYCLPGTLNVSFKHVEGESILLYLDLEGIAVSTGSACATGSLEPSYVLRALGLEPETAHGSIRFSLGRENTEEDIDIVLAKLPVIIEKLRAMSPLVRR